MYITFKNGDTGDRVRLIADGREYLLDANGIVQHFCSAAVAEFTVEPMPKFDFTDDAAQAECRKSLKNRVLDRMAGKLLQKLPETVACTAVKYRIDCGGVDSITVNLSDGVYSVCDGKFADVMDLLPIGILFVRAECAPGRIAVCDAFVTNRKKFLRLMRNVLLFKHWGFLFLDLFFFLPEYLLVRFYSSRLFVKKLLCGLYAKTTAERSQILNKQIEKQEKEEKGGCVSALLKGGVLLAVIAAVCWWGMTSEPEVIVSNDLQRLECFDEVFVRFDGGLPADAEKSFLEDYDVFYPLATGGYDTENYYCYIYETADGERYLWLKDDWADKKNRDKTYAEYEDPLVYKSTGIES